MLKKTSASTGLVIVTAAGALLASSPAYALDSLAQGCCSSHNHHRSHHRNRNWNGNHHRGRIFIRIYIYNKNNNHAVAIAKPERRHRREWADDRVRDVTPVRRPAREFVDSAPVQQAPVAAPPAQNATDNAPTTPVAPATSSGTAPGLDEASTG